MRAQNYRMMPSIHSAFQKKSNEVVKAKPVILTQSMGELAYAVHIQLTSVVSKYKLELI